jgi:phytoene dehydrogenase-like protein
MPKKYDYDAVIIGAGISGLVCGCYLAKAGMKTLIVEKNAKPGGYCSSFKRGQFHFDSCAHSLGSLRKGGNIARILKELDIDKKINITRYDPSDIIISSDYKISFWNDVNRTIDELQRNFKRESDNINRFFGFIKTCRGLSLISLRKKTFRDLLDKYFRDDKLKSILSLPILGNTGFSVSRISAFTAVTVYKEFLLDGGYYPVGGMQKFANLFFKKFKELGGDVLLAKVVKKIKVKNNMAAGVILKDETFVTSKFIVSNTDIRHTYLNMLGSEFVSEKLLKKLDSMIPSLSMFVLYLGIDNDFNGLPKGSSSIWYLPHYNVEGMYNAAVNGEIDNLDWFLLRVSDDRKSMLRFVNSSFKDRKYWKENKQRLIDLFIKKTEHLVPRLSRHIVFKDAATPSTLNKWTMNYKGAAYGWAGIPSQFWIEGFSKKTAIHNLFITGHWATLFQGIPGVAYLGRETAKTIVYRRNNV